MGLSFRKSFKIGKNTRINLSKTGGIGISTGVKGARVSVNQKGVRTQAGSNGIYYRKDYSFKNGSKSQSGVEYSENIIGTDYTKPVKIQDAIEHNEELKAVLKKARIIVGLQWFCTVFGLIFMNPVLLVGGLVAAYLNIVNKKGKYGTYLNSAVNYANLGKSDKAIGYLNKAKKIDNSVIVQELESLL